MKILRVLLLALDDWHLEWAQREINPMHPDVGYIAGRRLDIAEAVRRSFA